MVNIIILKINRQHTDAHRCVFVLHRVRVDEVVCVHMFFRGKRRGWGHLFTHSTNYRITFGVLCNDIRVATIYIYMRLCG